MNTFIFIFLTIFVEVFSLKINLAYPEVEEIHTRLRRDVSDSTTVPAVCKKALNDEAKKKIEKNSYPLSGDKNHGVSLVWLGDKKETQILLTTSPELSNPLLAMFHMHGSPSNVYRSTNGGKSFTNIEAEIGKEAIRKSDGILKSPVDPNRLILVSYVSTNFLSQMFSKPKYGALVITKDGGKNFKVNKLTFKLRSGNSIHFHPTNKDWIIALEEISMMSTFQKTTKTGCAYISKDFGETWTPLLKNEIVKDVKWGHENDIFALTKVFDGSFLMHGFDTTSNSSLYKSTNQKDFTVVVESCWSFGVQDQYIFATVSFEINDGTQKRIIHVSRDGGENFNEIHTPAITSDMFFAILQMDRGLIFLHVDEANDSGKGTLYISGPEGRVYEESLKDHFYTNSGFTDFFNVESMPGVYITQQLLDDNSLRSVITFDRGIKWQPLYVDRKKYCTDKKYTDDHTLPCTLHYHHEFSKQQRHNGFSRYIQSPLSTPGAPGLILIHGQAGDALTGKMNIWMSKNGGYDWTEIAKGPHHYAIGDSGNLIVLVPKINSTGTTLKYSIDQGRCWHEFQFTDANQPLVIEGLVTEPHSQERSFSLWGHQKNAKEAELVWEVVTVDFQNMFAKQCASEDMEQWHSHLGNGKEGCYLGEKITYKRPKEDKVCYVGPNFNPIVTTEPCKCTNDDVVCDYGYERNGQNKCVRNKKLKLMFCKDGEEEKESPSKGYRRVPGNKCDTKEVTESHVKLIDQEKKCTKVEIEQEKESEVGIVSEEESQAKKRQELEASQAKKRQEDATIKAEFEERQHETPKKKKTNPALLVFGVVLVIAVLVAGAWYARKYMKSRSRTPPYIRSAMNGLPGDDDNTGNDNNDGQGYRRQPNQNYFKDESDADDDALLTV